jgi:ABC-type sugar transport system permease subunit
VNQEYNYAAAISFVLGAIVVLLSYVVMFAARRRSAG